MLENNKSLPDLSVEQGQMGDGSSPRSLSRAGIGRHPRGGCQLPDAILHGKRSLRPRSRAVQHLSAAGLSSEAFQPACAGGCATGLRTRQRHAYDFSFASSPLSSGSAAVFDGALARCHGSRLFTLRLPFAHSPAVSFLTSLALGSFSRDLPCPRVLPGACSHFVRLSAALTGGSGFRLTARVARTVLMHSSNQIPSG